MMPTVTLYVRHACHLCDVAHARLRRLRRSVRFELDVVDIEVSDALHAAYLERIPVIAVDGEEFSELTADIDRLRCELERS